MAFSRVCMGAAFALAFVFAIALPSAHALVPAPSPTSDGNTIDQGIACVLMLIALVLTYLIHTLDTPFSN